MYSEKILKNLVVQKNQLRQDGSLTHGGERGEAAKEDRKTCTPTCAHTHKMRENNRQIAIIEETETT